MQPDNTRSTTIARMSKDELSVATSPDAFFRSEGVWGLICIEEFDENLVKGVFEANVWPKTRVVSMWCEHTIWGIVQANWEFERRLEERLKSGVEARHIKSDMITGPNANHFV